MDKRFIVASLSLIATSFSTVATQPDTRFDGVWGGTETILQPFRPKPKVVRKRSAKIIIAQNGAFLAIVEGHCPGRYSNVRRSGDSLLFEAGDCRLQLSISADGKTLSETGASTAAVTLMSTVPRGPVEHKEIQHVDLSGTFHREN